MRLSKRLLALARLVKAGSRVADIGTDHGYLPAYLLSEGISPQVYCCDIHPLPLERAAQTFSASALFEGVSFRCADGLLGLDSSDLVTMKKRQLELIGIDLKRDVIRWCAETATALEFSGMKFINDDITNIPDTDGVDMVISLHACDVATDIVINTAAKLGARVILSTPCCHKYLNGKITNKNLSFVTDYPQLSVKFCEALTDAIRLARLKSFGYEVFARELTDPENTPKNTIIIAEKKSFTKEKLDKYQKEYENILKYLLDDSWSEYLSNI